MHRYFLGIFIAFILNTSLSAQVQEVNSNEYLSTVNISSADSLVLAKIWQFANDCNLHEKPLIDIELALAQKLLTTPYLGGTLDKTLNEELVINLNEFDCVTYVETVMALSFCIKNKTFKNSEYGKWLKFIRYRNGELKGYASRLHYFTEWLTNNEAKNTLKIVSEEFASDSFDTQVDIISKNKEKNARLIDDKVFADILESEKAVSKEKMKFIPQEKINALSVHIKSGDIVGFTTSINGLDFVHAGIAIYKQGVLHFLHASSAKGKVVISQETLYEYVKAKKSFNGIVVARLCSLSTDLN